jgi:hypothetical protein
MERGCTELKFKACIPEAFGSLNFLLLLNYILQYQQLKKKSTATALNTVLASAHIQMT